MHRLALAVIVAAGALVLAGCGGDGEQAAPEPALPRSLASDLATQAEAIAADYEAGNVCEAAQQADVLLDDVVTAVEAGRVPARLQESLTATAQKLVDRINCPEPAPPPTEETEGDEDKGKGKGKGNGKTQEKGNGESGTTTAETTTAETTTEGG